MRGTEPWEEEVDKAMEIMERIAKKARPKEDAAELIRGLKDTRRS